MNYKILVADDNPHSMAGLQTELEHHLDIQPVIVGSAKEAIKELKKDPFGFAAIVLDFHFEEEGTNGAILAKELLTVNNKLQIIICTGDMKKDPVIESLRARVSDFIPKSEINTLISSIRRCFPHYDETIRSVRQNEPSPRTRFSQNERYLRELGIIGRSDEMIKVYEKVKKSADSKVTVLITGECGTGKELVAKSLHEQSSRSHRNFVPINCGAIPDSLLESELFGHEKGAFTGAMTKKIGKFELAHGGTIFLDEIGDMPTHLQAKLLRVLQEEAFYPVGSNQIKKVDVRVVAATNVNLEKAVQEGRFREDLYYRLKVISVSLPPLRERLEDIEPLVVHFQTKYDPTGEKRILYKTLRYLRSHNWPGNVRELENVVQNLVTLSVDNEIGPENLPSTFFKEDLDIRSLDGKLNFSCDYTGLEKQLKEYAEEVKREYVLAKVREDRSLRQASSKIGMAKSTLQIKLKKWGYTFNDTGLVREDVAGL